MMMIMMMVMVVGFAYKLGKSSERETERGVGWLMSLVEKENGLERDLRERDREIFRCVCVFLSLTP